MDEIETRLLGLIREAETRLAGLSIGRAFTRARAQERNELRDQLKSYRWQLDARRHQLAMERRGIA